MKPFLLLASRDEDVAADDEYAAILRFGALLPGQLHRVRMERGPLPPIDLDRYSGVIVGGGPFNASTPPEEKSRTQRRVEAELTPLLDEIVERDFPFLGACYGVGTLGAHQGAIIDETYAEEVGPVSITLTEDGRSDPLLAGVPDTFAAFVGHKEAVRALPANATLLATSAACPVQMFRIKTNLYATQFHPELDLEGILTRIQVYQHHGYFAAEEVEAVSAVARSREVWAPKLIMENFMRRHARPA